MNMKYDVCIVGTGRVGLPLGLAFIEAGQRAIGVDVDPSLRATVNAGQMPFHEPGFEEVIASRAFQIHESPDVVAESRAIIVTVGTPLHNHIETDLRQIQNVLKGLIPHLRGGHLLCLRSTVAPGTTDFVRRFLERESGLKIGGGEDELRLAFCPERLAEGKAKIELRSLPQIVGTEDAASREAASALFAHLSPEIMHTDFVSAELVKLFNNIARYVHFALANQFALIADTYGANIHAIRHMANHEYPRNGIAAPGLTAGTCLRKDFGMINEWSPYPDLLLSAWKMNEYIPAFLVRHLGQRTPLREKVVAMLGYSFKADTDDVRDSLAPKLFRYIERETPREIRVTDHHLADPLPEAGNGELRNFEIDDALEGADCVFVATNHSTYGEALRRWACSHPRSWVADIWNVGGVNQVFYPASELIAKTQSGGQT